MDAMSGSRWKQPYLGMRGGWLTFWLTVSCSVDMALFGYDQGVFSGVVITDNYLDTLNLRHNTSLLSIVTSIYDIGCLFGAVLAFYVGERLGRKRSIVIGTSLMVVGCILQTSAFTPAQMIVARIVSGLGNGLNTATAPVWQTETSPSKWRGKLVMVELCTNIFGLMLVNWVNFGLSFVGGGLAWRLPIALQLLFMVVIFGTVFWLPESPRWLIAHGEVDKATEILAAIEDRPIDDPFIIANRKAIVFSVEYERENATRWRDLLRGRSKDGTKSLRRVILGAGTQFMQQFSGTNVSTYYLPTVLEVSVGLSDKLARLLTAVSTVIFFITAIIATPCVERFGRRRMMIISVGLQAFCWAMIAILLFKSETSTGANVKKYAEASVVFFFLYYVVYALGLLGTPWLYPTEINSLPMRTKGTAVSTMTNWIGTFIIVEITPAGVTNLHYRYYIIWAVFCAAFVPIVWLFYPETADRSLEDLDAYYRTDPSLIVFRDKDATSRRRPLRFIAQEEEDVMKEKSKSVDLPPIMIERVDVDGEKDERIDDLDKRSS